MSEVFEFYFINPLDDMTMFYKTQKAAEQDAARYLDKDDGMLENVTKVDIFRSTLVSTVSSAPRQP